MTGVEILAYIKRTFKRTDKDTEIYEAITDTVANIGIRLELDDTEKVSSDLTIDTLGDYKIALPDDFSILIGDVLFTNDAGTSYTLKKRGKASFDKRFFDQEYSNVITGKPTEYAIFGNYIYLGCVPDSTDYIYRINYSTKETNPITSGTSDVTYSEDYREVLKYGVLMRLYIDLDMTVNAQKYLGLYEKGINDIFSKNYKNSKTITTMKYRGI